MILVKKLQTLLAGLVLAMFTNFTYAIESGNADQTATAIDATTINDQDLWQRVRRGFAMGELVSPAVQEQELWYANRPDYIKRFVERGSRYLYHIVEEVERRGLPTEIVLLPIIESAFNPQANSHAKAAGMWQFIPSTGKNFGLKQDWMTDNRRDVLLSTNAAIDYLTKLHGMFNSWELAFAAYNCGEGCVGRAIANNERKGLPTDFASLTLPNETRAYVPKLIAVKNIILSPGSYGIELPGVENRPYFTKVAAPDKIDVKLAARLAELPEGEFQQLNPASIKPVAQTGSGYFLVPTENAATFKTNLELYRSLNGPMVSWSTVTAKRGQSVDAVARSHGMTASYLRATSGPFKERKGKFAQPVTFMAPNQKEAKAISVAFDKKVQLKREQQNAIVAGDDAPLEKSKIARENLQRAAIAIDIPAKSAYMTNVTTTTAATAATTTTANDGNSGIAQSSPNALAALPMTPIVAPSAEKAVAVPVATANAAAEATTAVAPASVTLGAMNTVPAPAVIETYTIQKGDTLFSLAKRANMPLDDLKAMNQLASNVVNIGQKIRVPQPLSATTAITSSTVDAAVIDTTPTTANSKLARVTANASTRTIPTTRPASVRFYKVRSGDTLATIARHYGTTPERLASWNRLSKKSVLKVGAKLRVSAVSA